MSMFCFQCQETAMNKGCTVRGVCGKTENVSRLQDAMLFAAKGLALVERATRKSDALRVETGRLLVDVLFTTITNVNFDDESYIALIDKVTALRNELIAENPDAKLPDHASVHWQPTKPEHYINAGYDFGVLATENEDVRSLRELLVYGVKGIAAYAHHAMVLGFENIGIYDFVEKALESTTRDLSVDEMIALVMECGEMAVKTMALLDEANTSHYGHPEITKVDIGVRKNPAILISGHDLRDMEMLLEQTKDSGVDVYTHSEMLPANYYPEFKKYAHLAGNYGSSWWKQDKEFESFNGVILMTTNCIVPVKESYRSRIFTTGTVRYPGVEHIEAAPDGTKDFSKLIALAKTLPSPTEIETGTIIGGFAHNQVLALAPAVIEAIKTGAIKRFVVMAGCDGRMRNRTYFEDVAQNLPKDTVILTAGCAKYRYNKLPLGDINGIPRVLDAGQCNDSYSLAVVALTLKDVFKAADVNDLPISFDIAWYEQKAVAVLLALLYLGFKGLRIGPTLPAFLSPNVAKVLVDTFGLMPIGEVAADIDAMMNGK